MHQHHDMGGEPAGPMVREHHELDLWERQVDILTLALTSSPLGVMSGDELRRNVEALPAKAYDELSYYERWISSLYATMLERGVVRSVEVEERIQAVLARCGEPS